MLMATLFTSVSFLYYGSICLFSRHMVMEFDRYGLPRYRGVVGVLQLVGAVGLLIGLHVSAVGFLASTGLAVMMLMGLVVRLKIRDRVIRSLPALFYMVLNLGMSVGYLLR